MHYPKVLERVDSPEQIFHRSFSLGAPVFYGASEQRLIVSKDIVVRRPMSRFAAYQLEVD